MTGLHFGVFESGDRLPSVRDLASEFDADPRVVLAAYRELEREGLVEVRTRSGIYVAPMALSAGERLPQVARWVVEVLVDALSRGIPPVEFPERMRRCLETLRLRAACIEDNVDQITGLCAELHEDYGVETSPVEVGGLTADETPHELKRADLLVTTTFHAAEVQRVAERLGKPRIIVSLRTEFQSEIARLLSQGPLYFAVADPRFADKLRQIFESTAKVENLRTVVVDRNRPSVPEHEPVYITRAARSLLGEAVYAQHMLPPMRVFSLEAARQILSYIVRANVAALVGHESEGWRVAGG